MLIKFHLPFHKSLIALLLISTSCVDPYLKKYTGEETIFVVEGRLTNDTDGNYVKLTESIPKGLNTNHLPTTEAMVKVLVNGSSEILLTETDYGYYSFPADFRGHIGDTYQLQFTTAKGQYFESRSEEMLGAPEINKVYHDFAPDAVKSTSGFSSGHNIYLDTQDPVETQDYYMWDWKLYEQQFVCQLCDNGYYYRDDTSGPLGECREINYRRATFGYTCEESCWEIIRSSNVNVMSDELSNGKEIKARLITELPIYQKTGALIVVKQYGISKAAYNYLRLVKGQGQDTGGLADTPPAALTGNITSPDDPNQPVAGFFIVSSATKVSHWLDKTDIPFETESLGLFNGRVFQLEEMGNDTSRPPLAPCINSETRTNYVPEGWYGDLN